MKSVFSLVKLCLIAGIFLLTLTPTQPPTHANGNPTLPGITNIEFVSVGTGNVPSNDDSFSGFPSYDGRFISFMSWDDGWVPEGPLENTNCENHCFDIFVRDRLNQTTIKASIALDNNQTGDDVSIESAISGDGRYVVFDSYAGNLVPDDDNGDTLFLDDGEDTFIFDQQTGVLERFSRKQNGSEIAGESNAAMISGDGEILFFASTGEDVLPNAPVDSHNVYRLDRATRTIEQILTSTNGLPLNEQTLNFSTDETGRYLVFTSHASNLVSNDFNNTHDAFLYDHETRTTTLLSRKPDGSTASGNSGFARISYDGKYVVFRSDAPDITPNTNNGVSDIFRYEIATDEIILLSHAFDGSPANGASRDPSICEGGRFISFTSDASNIIPDDTNGLRDAFILDMELGEIRTVAITHNGSGTNGAIQKTIIFPDCQGMVYASDATNILPGDTNGYRDIFAADLIYPADLRPSRLTATPFITTTEPVTYTLYVTNDGDENVNFSLVNPLPDIATFVPDSATNGAIFNTNQNRVEWNGSIPAHSTITAQYILTFEQVSAEPNEMVIVANNATLDWRTHTVTLTTADAFNVLERVFVPIVTK